MRNLVLGAVMGMAVLADGAAAAAVPLPQAKPQRPEPAAAIPLPQLNPERPCGAPDPAPSARAGDWPREAGRWPSAVVNGARAECDALLTPRRMTWRPAPTMGHPGGCGTAAPVTVSGVAGIRIDPPATFNCPMAAAVHDWLVRSVQPAAERELGMPIVALRNASTYVCRRRNNRGSGKISEHGTANALDIAGFTFAREGDVTVAGAWSGILQAIGLSKRGNFLREVRKGSCAYFNTVLGPGTDPHHKDHFHLDLMRLRPGRSKMCQ